MRRGLLYLIVVLLAMGCTRLHRPAPTPRVETTVPTVTIPVVLDTPTAKPPTLTVTPSLTPTSEPTATFTPTATPEPSLTPTPTPTPEPQSLINFLPVVVSAEQSWILIGAGDIGDCLYDGRWLTAQLLDQYPDATIFTAGDNVQVNGRPEEFFECFEPTWGRHKARIRPAMGNHDIVTDGGTPYYAYFGPAAGEPGKGYYSYNLGPWHILVINSNLAEERGAAMEQWVRDDLAANLTRCSLAYWHHPRFSSGWVGSDDRMKGLWNDLYAAGVDVVVNGHDHHYERFAPQDPDGNFDSDHGIRQFISGTGGTSFFGVEEPIANSEMVITNTYGLLKFSLYSDRYEWSFLSAETGEALDTGWDFCR